MITVGDIRDALTVVLTSVGVFFFVVGTVGLLRLPDFFTRSHATSKCDTVGAGTLLLGVAVFNGAEPSTLKILLLAALVLLSSPTASHALARAAHRTGLAPWRPHEEDER
ncbi:MAG TPA: monovalent cation/H(+) antiporter subunit G [Coriobacteriia bacterium]|nr:monovalent cation/H(+) antiporter subunit G [Coriobacteriia bacterium]